MGFRQVLFCLIVLAVCAELVIGQGAGYEGRRRPRPRPRPPIGGGDGYEGRRPRPRPPVGEGYEGRTRGHICPTPLCHCQGLGSTISYDHNGCEICTCNQWQSEQNELLPEEWQKEVFVLPAEWQNEQNKIIVLPIQT